MRTDYMIPEGYFNAVAVAREGEDGMHKVRWGISGGDAKAKQVLVYFEVLDGEWAGTVIPWFGFFSKAAAKRTVESLRYMGFKGDDLTTLASQTLDQKVSILVEHNEYNDKVYPRVAFVNKVGGGAMKLKSPMNEKQIREFAAVMKQSVAKVDEHEGEAATPGADNGHANGTSTERDMSGSDDFIAGYDSGGSGGNPAIDDDIPF